MRISTIAALALALAACAEEPPQPVAFVEQCGVAGPTRLVATTPDRVVSFRIKGDRTYYSALPVDADGKWIEGPRPLDSVGPCGESPRAIADDATFLDLDRWPDLLFGCVTGTGIFSLDPEGQQPPHLAIPTTADHCSLFWSPHGVLDVETHDDDTSTVVFRSIPADPRNDTSESEVLLANTDRRTLASTPDALYYLDDATLMRLDLADRSTTAVQSGVHNFQVTKDERYLLWQDITMTGGSADDPRGVVNLRDNTTGSSVSLGGAQERAGSYGLSWAAHGILYHRGGDHDRLYFLADLNFIDLPPYTFLVGPQSETLWLIEGLGEPSIQTLDLSTGTLNPIFRDPGQIVGSDHDSLHVHALGRCCGLVGITDEAPVWDVPIDGSRARVIAERAAMFTTRQIDATRMIVGVDVSDDRRMTLLLVDLDTRREQIIDHDVTGWNSSLDDPTLLTYGVRDGERSGLWRVRLPPAP